MENVKRQKNGVWKVNDEFMNLVCCWAAEASAHYEQNKLHSLAKNADKFRVEAFNIMREAGYYDDVLND